MSLVIQVIVRADRTGCPRGERRCTERAGLVDGRDLQKPLKRAALARMTSALCRHPAGDHDADGGTDDIVHRSVQRQRFVGGSGDDRLPYFAPGPTPPAIPPIVSASEPRPPTTTRPLGRLLGGGVEHRPRPSAPHAEHLEHTDSPGPPSVPAEQRPVVGFDARVGGDARGGQPGRVGATPPAGHTVRTNASAVPDESSS